MPSKKPQVGQTVLLRGGTKSKRKYNKEEALVEDVPARGCWMTVQIQPSGATVKWRKGGFRAVKKKTDPFIVLNDEVSIKILSFLYGERPAEEDGRAQTLWLRKVAHQCGTMRLRLASPFWNAAVKRILPDFVGPVAVDLFDHSMRFLVYWLSIHEGIKLSSLLVRHGELGDIPLLSKLILSCSTADLTQMELTINRGRAESSGWAYYGLQNDLVVDLSQGRIETAVPIHTREQKTLHAMIAQQCPNLTELELTVTLPSFTSNYDDYLSADLFSMPSIQTLKLSMGYFDQSRRRRDYDNLPIDSGVITKLVRNLSGLKRLEISSPNTPLGYMRRYHIASQSLEHLDVTKLGKKMMVSCNCESLATFRCEGNFYGNGCMPILTEPQYHDLDRHYAEQDTNSLVVTASTFHFPHFTVPDSCQMTLEGFNHCTRGDYDRYNGFAQEAANARFQIL